MEVSMRFVWQVPEWGECGIRRSMIVAEACIFETSRQETTFASRNRHEKYRYSDAASKPH